ncbi:MAG: cysteine--tRNA ligase [Gemmatimonadetes bacterium]|nr:cysteine--tRNA ligase [Gemmatimonadota bacterium]
MALHVYDTLRRKKVLFEPLKPGHVGMYVCGMTVQSIPHVGHMRAYVTADLMRRVFRSRGYEVLLVQNFTDIDDKIIAKANEAGTDYKELVEQNIQAYFEAADWLGIERADVYPRATEHIPEILEMIGTLIEKDVAYATGGDVFFDVTRKEDYGKLSGRKLDELRSGVRIEVDEDKRHPVDFALWKAAKPDEPAWDSPWGRGRPGWHIECSAMAMKYLGATLDLHGGGRDLVFPHHENELAQSEAATGCPFCRHWAENGLVNLGGQKMSKSTGVVFNVEDVRKEVDSVTLRLYLLSTHYRSPIEYGKERLEEAAAKLERIRNFLHAADHAAGESDGDAPEAADLAGVDAALKEAIDAAEDGFERALDDDFNSAGALGKLFELVRDANSYVADGAGSPHYGALLGEARDLVLGMGDLLGLELAAEETSDTPAEVLELVQKREDARRGKDWAAADSYRDAIQAAGWVVEDRPDGPLVKPLG